MSPPPSPDPPVPLFPSQETTLYGCTVRINELVGVIGIACPDESPLLAFVSLFAPAVVRSNTIIIVPSEKHPLSATDLYQVNWREGEVYVGKGLGGGRLEEEGSLTSDASAVSDTLASIHSSQLDLFQPSCMINVSLK